MTGKPTIHAYVHPNAKVQKEAKPFSGIWLQKVPATTITHPIRLSTAIVASKRPTDFTNGDFSQSNRQNVVGTASNDATQMKSLQQIASTIFNK
jgi:hypothetical protein